MNQKKAKKLRKVARVFAQINPNTTVDAEYKKLKSIHKKVKGEI